MPVIINGSTGISGIAFDTVNVSANLTVTNTLTANIISANVISDSKGEVRNLPVNNQVVTYTLVLADSGKLVSVNNTVTVPNTIFFPGNVISLYNNSSAGGINVTNAGAVTMYLASTNDSNTRNLSSRGLATIVCIAANTFVISGAGLS